MSFLDPKVKGAIQVGRGNSFGTLPVGVDGQVIIADSAQAEGVKWGAAPGGWTVTGSEVHLSVPTNEVTVGPAGGSAGKFTVVGDTAAQDTVVVKKAAAQTADAFVVQDSVSADLFKITADTYFSFGVSYTETNFGPAAAGDSGGSWYLYAGDGFNATSGDVSGAGGFIVLTAGKGGNAFAAASRTASLGGNVDLVAGDGGDGVNGATSHPGVSGGYVDLTSGDGGSGSTSTPAGAGGWIVLTAGDAGADLGGGGAVGGSIEIDAGVGSGGSQNGDIYIGTTSTTNMVIIGGPAITRIDAQLQTTTSSAEAALRIGSFAGDPSTLADGDIWYNSTTNKFRARENGVSVNLV